MTEVGESVVALLIEDPDHDPKTCCFCQKGKPVERENVFKPDPEEDNRAHLNPLEWVKFNNDSGTLGANLNKDGTTEKVYWIKADPGNRDIHLPCESTAQGAIAVKCSPHHLIPGEESFARSSLKKVLGDEGKGVDNVGYNINKAANGVWAPANHAIRPWSPLGVGFKGSYAEAAILTAEVQFHDRHVTYSKTVLRALDEMAKKVTANKRICPHADKEEKPTRLITLVARLDSLSERCRRMVSYPNSRWKSCMFLSRFSKEFMTKHTLGD